MDRNTRWIVIGASSAVLMAVLLAGCTNQNSNPDNVPGASPPATKNTASTPSMNTNTAGMVAGSTASFDDASNIWSKVEEARAELDTAIKDKKLDQVHEAATKISDLVKTLPDKSAMLPEDKRKTLDAHVENVGELTAMMNKSTDPTDMKSTQDHQTAMHDALDMIKGIYPAGAMRSSMHMPNMSPSSKGMSDDAMPGRGMGGKMGGMGNGMPGRGMGGKMGGPAGGMPGKGMGDMPGMGGTGAPAAPGKPADPNGKPMPPSGGMSGDM